MESQTASNLWKPSSSLPLQNGFSIYLSAHSSQKRITTSCSAIKDITKKHNLSVSISSCNEQSCNKSSVEFMGTINAKMGLFEGVSSTIEWVALVLYRALLIGGLGFSMSAPALAESARSSTVSISVQETIEKQTLLAAESGTSAEKEGANDVSTHKDVAVHSNDDVVNGLEDEFWSDIDLSKGSMESLLKNILDTQPNNISALECLAKRLVENDDFHLALVVFEKLVVLDPTEMEWKYMKAQAYDMDGQYELAKKGFEDILKQEPLSVRALQGLVIVMDQLGEKDAAIRVVEETMAKAKEQNKFEEAHNMGMLLGQFLMLKGHLHEALHQYKLIMDEDANDFRPYLCQGIIYSMLGDKAMAEKQFKKYDKLCPKDFPDRKFLDGIMSRAKKEGGRLYSLKGKESKKKSQKESKK